MKRTLLKTLAAMVLLATPAFAQDGNFTFVAGAPNAMPFTGRFNADYAGGDVLAPLTPTTFSIFCVDPLNNVSVTDTYDVWVTGIAGANGMAQTRLGQAGFVNAYDRYWRAAYLASNFSLIAGPTAQQQYDYQHAIWEVTWVYLTGSNGNSNSLAATANALIPNATGFSAWGVITDVASIGRTGGRQEFIYNQPDGGLNISPEPATMSLLAMGLAGMAGAGMRRRKKK